METCPQGIFKRSREGGKTVSVEVDASRVAHCMACGHCMAICPSGAVRAGGLEYGVDVVEPAVDLPAPDSVFALLETRRACRAFREEPVTRELLEKVVEGIATAPPGFPPWKVELTVVQDRAIIERALPRVLDLYEKLVGWMGNPFVRFFLRRGMKAEDYVTIKDHLLPLLKTGLEEGRGESADWVCWGAPAMILFHADRESSNHTEDAHIAVALGWLAAHALGLGATAIGLMPPAVQRTPELRELFRIPENNEVVGCLILGHPRRRFRRAIRRKPAAVHWL